jgi:hypothetical protein
MPFSAESKTMMSTAYAREHERPFDPAKDIFVFGSNEEGLHYAGAARFAQVHCGAQPGVGVGPAGRSYAIPTMNGWRRLAEEAARFVDYAAQHPGLPFFVTRIGCGIAGYQDKEIAPLFVGAPENCLLPLGWRDLAKLPPPSPKAR